MSLSQEQKDQIVSLHGSEKSLIEITREVFNDLELDGRSKEGRSVREFLSKEGLEYNTTKREKVPDIVLSSEQKNFIEQYSKEGMNTLEIAKLIFGAEVEVKKLGKEKKK